jgi:anti-anti-sigma regulatory factor
LRQIHEELESRVERRTAQLARANAELEAQSAERLRADRESALLREEVIRMQAALLEELSTPLIPLSDRVVIMPLVGTIDSKRAGQVLEVLSQGVVARGARIAIIDITGVPTVDTHVASVLIRAAQAVRLLGAEVVLTGIRPKVAKSLVELRVELGGLVTRSNLQAGISYARWLRCKDNV